MRRAVGITSYYRVTPIHKPAKPRPADKEDKPDAVKELPITVVKQETTKGMDLEGQALLCLVIILLLANIINQVIILCG